MERKVAVVTGGSRGIGYASARQLALAGCSVYELSRHRVPNEGVEHVDCDVTDFESVRRALDLVAEREGRIDVLVCNAGTVLSGAVEFTGLEDSRALFDLNFFGAVNSARAALRHMRKTGGRIVFISSVAAVFPVPFQAVYSASKAAVSALSFALANEVRPFGVSVCAVLPGDTKTSPVRRKVHEGDDAYGGRISRSVAVMERDEENGMDPDYVGRKICRVALKKRVKPFYVVGLPYKIEALLSKVLPSGISRWAVGLIYGGGKAHDA